MLEKQPTDEIGTLIRRMETPPTPEDEVIDEVEGVVTDILRNIKHLKHDDVHSRREAALWLREAYILKNLHPRHLSIAASVETVYEWSELICEELGINEEDIIQALEDTGGVPS